MQFREIGVSMLSKGKTMKDTRDNMLELSDNFYQIERLIYKSYDISKNLIQDDIKFETRKKIFKLRSCLDFLKQTMSRYKDDVDELYDDLKGGI